MSIRVNSSLVRAAAATAILLMSLAMTSRSCLASECQEAPSTNPSRLTGLFTDKLGNAFELVQTGSSVSLQTATGRVFEGTFDGNVLKLGHALSFDETNARLPAPVRNQLVGHIVTLLGPVSPDGNVIDFTYGEDNPAWKEVGGQYTITEYRRSETGLRLSRLRILLGDGPVGCPAYPARLRIDDDNAAELRLWIESEASVRLRWINFPGIRQPADSSAVQFKLADAAAPDDDFPWQESDLKAPTLPVPIPRAVEFSIKAVVEINRKPVTAYFLVSAPQQGSFEDRARYFRLPKYFGFALEAVNP